MLNFFSVFSTHLFTWLQGWITYIRVSQTYSKCRICEVDFTDDKITHFVVCHIQQSIAKWVFRLPHGGSRKELLYLGNEPPDIKTKNGLFICTLAKRQHDYCRHNQLEFSHVEFVYSYRSLVKSLGGTAPVDTYIKGDFKGVLFAKFMSKGAHDVAVDLLRKAGCKEGGNDIWGKPDLPLADRCKSSFAFGLKYLLVQWGFEKKSLWASPEDGGLWVGDDLVASATMTGKIMDVKYGEGWEDYLNDSSYPEFKEMVKRLATKLEQSPTKGLGKVTKGKGASKGASK